MKKLHNIAMLLFFFCFVMCDYGSTAIMGVETLEIDFTKPFEVQKKVDWSNKQYLSINENGLGFEGEGGSSRDVRIDTIGLLAVGVSWRAAQSTRIQAEVELANVRNEISLGNGEKHEVSPHPGRLFVRHSPDAKNWTTWQEMDRDYYENPESDVKKFQGTVGVPYTETKTYYDYLAEYQKLDVPWKDDEEAAVKWILDEKNPKFFEQHTPFVGYLQFHYEASLRGGERLKLIKISASYGVGGLHSPPSDESVYKDRHGPWKFNSQ